MTHEFDVPANIAYWTALLAAWAGDVGLAIFAQLVALNIFFLRT